jgi:hypothetical protein
MADIHGRCLMRIAYSWEEMAQSALRLLPLINIAIHLFGATVVIDKLKCIGAHEFPSHCPRKLDLQDSDMNSVA